MMIFFILDCLLVTIHFHWMSFCGLQKKESHTSLKQHDNEEINAEFLFLDGPYI